MVWLNELGERGGSGLLIIVETILASGKRGEKNERNEMANEMQRNGGDSKSVLSYFKLM